MISIEIRNAPVGDENIVYHIQEIQVHTIEIRNAPVGDENWKTGHWTDTDYPIEIRNAPVGDENGGIQSHNNREHELRLGMPR